MFIALLAILVQSPPQAPPPTVTIPRIDTVITVDGKLDEPVWAKAARLEGFHQYRPVDGRPAEEETILLVWYSPTAIHIGVIAHDTDPGSIRATFTDRDKIDGEDRVRIYLDTFNDRRRAAFFGVNGLGIQEDGLRSETGTNAGSLFGGQDDLNVDFLWDSKGQVTDRGYEVEIRIPFKSLQYGGSGPQTWGFNATRYVKRTAFEDTWSDVRRANSSFLAQEGTITGLQDMQRGVVFEAQPFVTASWNGTRNGTTGEFTREDPSPSAGINLQLATTSMAFDGTVNPDFSQIESDAGLITVNERFALFLPEKRPFFLKGIDLFTTPGQLIYTRQIVDPLGGAKLTGKLGRNSIAYLGAVDEFPPENAVFNLLRVRRDLGTNSVAGLTYTDRIQGQAYNRLLEGDAHIVFATLYFVEAQYGQSWTDLDNGLGTASDPIWKLTFDRTGRTWGFNYSINGIGTDFVAGAGFVPRTDIVTAHIFNRLSFYGAKGALLENFTTFFGPTWLYGYQDFTHTAPLEGNEEITLQFQLRGGWQLSNVVQRDYTTFAPESYAGIETSPGVPFVPPPTLDNLFTNKFSVTTPTYQTFNAAGSVSFGEVPLYAEGSEGRGTSITASLNLRPTTTLRFEGSLAYQHLTRASDGSEFANSVIPRFKIEFQPSVPLFFRVIAQYQSTRRAALRDPATGQVLLVNGVPSTDANAGALQVDWLASYEPSPGTVAFLGYGSTSATAAAFEFSTLERQTDGFFVKLAYLYRR
jgi:hypothetical protein